MKTVLLKTLKIEHKLHDFENGFVYVEHWANNSLKDCFFAYKGDVFPDGTIKNGKTKFFYSRESGENIKKEVEPICIRSFKWFDKLYFVNLSGEVQRIDGVLAKDCDYSLS